MNQGCDACLSQVAQWLKMFVLAAAACAGEANGETYVILSMVGDQVTVVTYDVSGKTHSHVTPLAPPGLDDFVARTADAAIAKARPDAATFTIRSSDPEVTKVRDSWLDGEVSGGVELASTFQKQLPPLSDAHLLLITPYRDQLKLRFSDEVRVFLIGKVSGLGFYMDSISRTKRLDTGVRAPGLFGVFADFQLVLIDLQSGAIDGHQCVVLGIATSAAFAKDYEPWKALSEPKMAKQVESLIKQGIEGKLPDMLRTRKPNDSCRPA